MCGSCALCPKQSHGCEGGSQPRWLCRSPGNPGHAGIRERHVSTFNLSESIGMALRGPLFPKGKPRQGGAVPSLSVAELGPAWLSSPGTCSRHSARLQKREVSEPSGSEGSRPHGPPHPHKLTRLLLQPPRALRWSLHTPGTLPPLGLCLCLERCSLRPLQGSHPRGLPWVDSEPFASSPAGSDSIRSAHANSVCSVFGQDSGVLLPPGQLCGGSVAD